MGAWAFTNKDVCSHERKRHGTINRIYQKHVSYGETFQMDEGQTFMDLTADSSVKQSFPLSLQPKNCRAAALCRGASPGGKGEGGWDVMPRRQWTIILRTIIVAGTTLWLTYIAWRRHAHAGRDWECVCVQSKCSWQKLKRTINVFLSFSFMPSASNVTILIVNLFT